MCDKPSGRQADAELQEHEGRGVYVPSGMTAAQIMTGARILERDFGIAPYTSREIMRALLSATGLGTVRA